MKQAGPTRVLWLIKGLGLGGAERLLVNAAPYLNRDEFEYEVGYFLPWKNALVPPLEERGLKVTCFGNGSPTSLRSVRGLCRHLRQRRVDVLHTHLPWAGIIGRIAARRYRVPAVIYTEHGCWSRLHPMTRVCNRLTLGWNDLTIAVSDEVRNSMHGTDRRRICTITNGIDCSGLTATPDERAGVLAEWGIAQDEFVVVSVANLTAVKNHDLLLRAFALFVKTQPRSRLVLVGQLRETTDEIRQLAQELGIRQQVILTGPRNDVPRLVKAADVFALSSLSEGLPISLLEAMALAKPVVCTRVGGIPSVVTDGVEGLLVPLAHPGEMANRFAELHAHPAARARMGDAGHHKVRAHYDISVMVGKVEAAYRRMLEKRK